MTDFVTVEHLTKTFGDLTAVDDLSFSVHEGEIFGFLGPNGAGKSTTLNVITTLINYDQGNVTIGGYHLPDDEKAIKGLIGVVPQNIALYPTLTALENVTFFASLYGLRGSRLKKAALEALKFVGLSDQTKIKAGKMSGGTQRRLNIACGIAHAPKLIVMDEPTVGVDAQSRELMIDSIRSLREKGATIIYTSHYMPEVQEICDRIAIIDHGRLAAIGSEEELLEVVTDHKTIHVHTDTLDTAKKELISNKLKQIPNVHNVSINDENNQIRIDVPLSFKSVNPLLRIMVEEGIPVRQLNSEAPNLETTFLALTGRELR